MLCPVQAVRRTRIVVTGVCVRVITLKPSEHLDPRAEHEEQYQAAGATNAFLAQVGEVHRGNGHLSLEYHLNARPSAKLDLSDALRDAGHDIPLR